MNESPTDHIKNGKVKFSSIDFGSSRQDVELTTSNDLILNQTPMDNSPIGNVKCIKFRSSSIEPNLASVRIARNQINLFK